MSYGDLIIENMGPSPPWNSR